MVAVPVRDRDHVDALGRLLVSRALRIPVEERVDVDALSGRVEPEGGVSKPCEFHGASLLTEGPSDADDEPISTVGSRLLPLSLVTVAFAAGSADLGRTRSLARPPRDSRRSGGVLRCRQRPARGKGHAAPRGDELARARVHRPRVCRPLKRRCRRRRAALATWALLAALFAYSVPTVAWVLEPVKVTRTRPERRRRRPRPVIETAEILEEAA